MRGRCATQRCRADQRAVHTPFLLIPQQQDKVGNAAHGSCTCTLVWHRWRLAVLACSVRAELIGDIIHQDNLPSVRGSSCSFSASFWRHWMEGQPLRGPQTILHSPRGRCREAPSIQCSLPDTTAHFAFARAAVTALDVLLARIPQMIISHHTWLTCHIWHCAKGIAFSQAYTPLRSARQVRLCLQIGISLGPETAVQGHPAALVRALSWAVLADFIRLAFNIGHVHTGYAIRCRLIVERLWPYIFCGISRKH